MFIHPVRSITLLLFFFYPLKDSTRHIPTSYQITCGRLLVYLFLIIKRLFHLLGRNLGGGGGGHKKQHNSSNMWTNKQKQKQSQSMIRLERSRGIVGRRFDSGHQATGSFDMSRLKCPLNETPTPGHRSKGCPTRKARALTTAP